MRRAGNYGNWDLPEQAVTISCLWWSKISKTLHPDQYREENILSCLACSDAHLGTVVLLKHQQTATLYATPSKKTSLGKTEGKKKKQKKKKQEKKNKNKRKEIVLLTMLMLWIHFHNSPTRQIQPFWDSYPNPNYHSNYSNVVDDGWLSSLLWPRYWSCQWTTSSSAVPILMLFAMSTSGQCPAPKTPELGDSWSQFCRLKMAKTC